MLLPADHIHHSPNYGPSRYVGNFSGGRRIPLYLPPMPGLGC